MTWRLSLFGLVFGPIVAVPAWSRAQDSSSESPRWRWDDVVEAEEVNYCTGEDGIESVNYAYWEDIYVPCFARFDTCKGNIHVLNVGDARVGRINTTYHSNPDAYFQASQCGWASSIGYTGGPLYVYVDNVIGIDFNCSSSLTVGVDLRVEEWNSTNCTGAVQRTWYDSQDCWVMCLNNAGYHHMAAQGIGDCGAGEMFEPDWSDFCHMPDVYIGVPNTAHSYKYYIVTWVLVGGSWQYGTQSLGCFTL